MLRGLWVLGEPLPHALALAKALGTGYSHHRIPPPKCSIFIYEYFLFEFFHEI